MGLAAAIALHRALPRSNVVIVPTPASPAALADRATTFLPSSNAFHDRYGIGEAGLAVQAGASHRLAVMLAEWTGAKSRTLVGYGAAPADGLDPIVVPTVTATLAAAERFSHPVDEPASPLADIDYALRISPQAYRRHLSALAARLGITRRDAELATAVPDSTGAIAQLKLADGEMIAADLYVDCSGPEALVASALSSDRAHDWAHTLPCDRLLLPEQPLQPQISAVDHLIATRFGWRSMVHGRDANHIAFAASSSVGSLDEQAMAAGFEPAAVIALSPGRRSQLWQGNVICFGDAAARFEPLHWLNLSLAHAQIMLFLELLPGRDAVASERREYNRRAGAMADRARDFIALHYHSSSPAHGPFWSLAAALERPDSLELTLSEYTRRGRLPYFEEELLSRDAWKLALATVGLSPGPAARLLAMPEASRAALADQQGLRNATARQLAHPYPQWLARYLEAAR